jgi:hypothetical protein
MTCTDAIQADLSAALDRIPPEARGVTCMRAVAQIESAAAEITSNLSLLEWEAGRVARVAEQRAERARVAEAEAAERDAEARAAQVARAQKASRAVRS